MDQVKQMVAAGVSLATAIKEALPMSVTQFADESGLSRAMTSEVLNLSRAPDLRTCAALSKALGGGPFDWAMLLWTHARPEADQFVTEPAA